VKLHFGCLSRDLNAQVAPKVQAQDTTEKLIESIKVGWRFRLCLNTGEHLVVDRHGTAGAEAKIEPLGHPVARLREQSRA